MEFWLKEDARAPKCVNSSRRGDKWKRPQQRVLTVSVSAEVSSVSGVTAGRTPVQMMLRRPDSTGSAGENALMEERSSAGWGERETQWAISPRQGLSWLLQMLPVLIGPEERGGRRKKKKWGHIGARSAGRRADWTRCSYTDRKKTKLFLCAMCNAGLQCVHCEIWQTWLISFFLWPLYYLLL